MELILITPGYSLLNHFPPSLLHLFTCSLSFSFRYAPLVSLCLLFLLFRKTKKKNSYSQCMFLPSLLPHFTTLHMDPEDMDGHQCLCARH